MKKKITYRPSKAQGAFGAVVGGIFVLIGLTIVIPTAGAFGVLWTLMALGITVMNIFRSFGKSYVGPQIEIEEEPSVRAFPAETEGGPAAVPDAKRRLEQLEGLKEAGLITDQEYRQKRQEILKDL